MTLLHHFLILRAQSKQTPTSPKNILGTTKRFWSIVTSPLYTISQQGMTCSLCFLFQWYFSFLDQATVPLLSHNNILDDIAKRPIHKPKGFLSCYRSNKNHLECIHNWKQTYEIPHQTENPIPSTKKVPTVDPAFQLDAFLLDGMTCFFLFGEKYDFQKRLGVATYFCFIFKGKQNKKENPKCDSLFGKENLLKTKFGSEGQVTYWEGMKKRPQHPSKSLEMGLY